MFLTKPESQNMFGLLHSKEPDQAEPKGLGLALVTVQHGTSSVNGDKMTEPNWLQLQWQQLKSTRCELEGKFPFSITMFGKKSKIKEAFQKQSARFDVSTRS